MYYILTATSTLWAVTLTAFFILLYRYRRLKKNPTEDAQLILADLMRGGTLVRVERIAPESVFLRRMR